MKPRSKLSAEIVFRFFANSEEMKDGFDLTLTGKFKDAFIVR